MGIALDLKKKKKEVSIHGRLPGVIPLALM